MVIIHRYNSMCRFVCRGYDKGVSSFTHTFLEQGAPIFYGRSLK